jgi:hypothetical protein
VIIGLNEENFLVANLKKSIQKHSIKSSKKKLRKIRKKQRKI